MDEWMGKEGKPTVSLDKYFRYVTSEGMPQKIQMRQFMEDSPAEAMVRMQQQRVTN